MDETLDHIVERKLEDIRYGKEFWMALCHKSWRTLEAIMAVSMNFLSRDKEVQDGNIMNGILEDTMEDLTEDKIFWIIFWKKSSLLEEEF